MKEQKQISDLGLAASLLACGEAIITVDKTNPRRVMFCFEYSDYLDELIDSYWSDSLKVSGRLLMEQIKLLKSRIYS